MLTDRKHISIRFSETRMRKRNKELSLLLDISSLISTSKDLKELLEVAIVKVLDHFGLDAGRIYLMDESGQFLKLAAYKGIEIEGLEKVDISEGFSGKAARTRSFIAQHVSELENKKRASVLKTKGFEIVICVPLLALEKVVGVMNLAAKKVISLDHGMIDLLVAIGNQIAIAVNDAKLLEEIKEKVKEVQERKETIKFFAYSASHDLKGPVIAIHGLTKRLHTDCRASLDERGKAYCDQILKASEQVLTLVENLNAYIVSREVPLNLEKVRLAELVEEIRNEFAGKSDKRRIQWVLPPTAPEITSDRLSTTRALRNLVDNALKYGGDGLSEIRIGYKEDETFHILSVGDNGVGIKEEDEGRLFELFQRNETSRGIEGSGLGLAIVKAIAEKHGGKVWLQSGKGKGAAFYFSIPKDL